MAYTWDDMMADLRKEYPDIITEAENLVTARATEKRRMVKRIIHKLKRKRFCPDCIYHDFVWEGITFRGNRCRYPADK